MGLGAWTKVSLEDAVLKKLGEVGGGVITLVLAGDKLISREGPCLELYGCALAIDDVSGCIKEVGA